MSSGLTLTGERRCISCVVELICARITTMNVTFDSNVWRPLVSPTVFPNDPDANHLEIIRQGIAKKSVSGFLVETIFTLEAIRRKDRKGFFGVYKGAIKTTTEVHNAGTIAARFSIGPSATHHANNNPYLEKHLNDALLLDFKLLRIPRMEASRILT